MTLDQMRGALGAAQEMAMVTQVGAMATVMGGGKSTAPRDVTYGEDA